MSSIRLEQARLVLPSAAHHHPPLPLLYIKSPFLLQDLKQIEGYYWRPIFTHIFKCKLKILMEPRASILYNITILNKEMLQLTFSYPQINYDLE